MDNEQKRLVHGKKEKKKKPFRCPHLNTLMEPDNSFPLFFIKFKLKADPGMRHYPR